MAHQEFRYHKGKKLGPYGPYLRKYRGRLLSRQRVYQLKMMKRGRCKICGSKKTVNSKHCKGCRTIQNAIKYRSALKLYAFPGTPIEA